MSVGSGSLGKDTHPGWSLEDSLELAHTLIGAVHAKRALDFGRWSKNKHQVNGYLTESTSFLLTVLLQEQTTTRHQHRFSGREGNPKKKKREG
jgi:hypothetical protein